MSKVRKYINLSTPEIIRARLAVARLDVPEHRAAYLRAIAKQARDEADELEREASEMLTDA
ncbi:hypothetical protein [Streptomyces fulvoviolaceus]|uniref:hypothetical protein n=1 Tax=Streptomyces fulvoviolaceus TaxID=285535 RepID=UPI0004C8B901|nr:hypothetical protein [Streptomyces fulvoviolaceus]